MGPLLRYNGSLCLPQTACAILVLLVCGLVAGRGEECGDPIQLMFHAEMCLTHMETPHNSTILGGLSEEAWQESCDLYNKTLKCVEDVFSRCPEDTAQIEISETMIVGLREGLGQFCENDETFQKYLEHSDCYARQESGTVKCMNKFLDSMTPLDTADNSNIEETTHHMCRSFKMLISCVNTIIGTNCGDDASALFESIVRAQVPSHVTSLCDIPEESKQQRSSHIASASCPAGSVTMLLLLLASVLLIV